MPRCLSYCRLVDPQQQDRETMARAWILGDNTQIGESMLDGSIASVVGAMNL